MQKVWYQPTGSFLRSEGILGPKNLRGKGEWGKSTKREREGKWDEKRKRGKRENKNAKGQEVKIRR
jgi:hypothetical protein